MQRTLIQFANILIPLDHVDQLSLLNKSESENLIYGGNCYISAMGAIPTLNVVSTARGDEFYATKAWSKVMGGSSSFNDPMREFDGLHLSDSI